MKQKRQSPIFVILLLISIPIASIILSHTEGPGGIMRMIGFPEDIIPSAEADELPGNEDPVPSADPIVNIEDNTPNPADEANEKPDRVADEDVVQTVPLVEPKRRAHAIADPNPIIERKLVFKEADDSYFDDALFIGDSRSVGLEAYGDLGKAKFFCKVSLSTAGIRSVSASVKGYGNVTLAQLFSKAKFGKVYIMLGINEVASKLDTTAGRYKELVDWVKQQQPDAVVYVMANMLVTEARSNKNIYGVNNARLRALNERQAENADNETVFYIDCNEYFGDGKGNLSPVYSVAGVHPYGKYYKTWGQWIKEHVAVFEEVVISEW